MIKIIKKVRFIENENPNRNSSGGIMSYIINLATYFKDKEIEVGLIGTGSSGSNKYKLFSFKSLSTKDDITNLSFFIRLFFSRIIKEIGTDEIVHVQRPEMVIPLKLRTKNKIICTLHGGQDIAVFQKKSLVFGLFYSVLLVIGFFLQII